MRPELHYGGTFDPVHAGHLAVAHGAMAALDTPVVFLPAADPPHRATPGASAAQRAHMLDLALAGEPRMRVDRRELLRPGPSYTADTLRGLRAEQGSNAPLAWLIGADAFRGLPGWHAWPELLDLAHFVVVERSGHDLQALPEPLAAACAGRWTADSGELARSPGGRVLKLRMPLHPASATELRRRLAAGEPDGGWLAPRVAGFIAREGLYRGGSASASV